MVFSFHGENNAIVPLWEEKKVGAIWRKNVLRSKTAFAVTCYDVILKYTEGESLFLTFLTNKFCWSKRALLQV